MSGLTLCSSGTATKNAKRLSAAYLSQIQSSIAYFVCHHYLPTRRSRPLRWDAAEAAPLATTTRQLRRRGSSCSKSHLHTGIYKHCRRPFLVQIISLIWGVRLRSNRGAVGSNSGHANLADFVIYPAQPNTRAEFG